jgi:hypothetical protein
MSTEKEIGYFDVMKSIITKDKVPEEVVEKHFVPFISMKWLSVDAKTCYSINELNSSRGIKLIPKYDEYIYLKRVVKLPKNKYLAFDKNDKEMDLIILTLSYHFKSGKEVAKEYIKIMGGEKVIIILEKIAQINNHYTTNEKILKLRNAINKKRKEILQIKGK